MKVINHSLSAAISFPCLLNVIKKLDPYRSLVRFYNTTRKLLLWTSLERVVKIKPIHFEILLIISMMAYEERT